MPTSVISAFDSETAGRVVEELVRAGFPERDVAILEGGEDELVGEIVARGFSRDDAREVAAGARRGQRLGAAGGAAAGGSAAPAGRGKRLVAAEVPEAKVDRAVEIMDRHETGRGGERE